MALVYCDECQDYAVHRYCLDTLPETFDEYVIWLCHDCEPKVVKSSTTDGLCPILSRESDGKNLKSVQVKRGNHVKKLEKKSKRKERPESCSSLQLLEMNCSQSGENYNELGRDNRLDEGCFLEVVESLESKHFQLSFSDPHLPEVGCYENGEKDQTLEAQNRLDKDGVPQTAGFLETINCQFTIGNEPLELTCCEHEDKDQSPGIQNDFGESSFYEGDEAFKSENSQLPTCDLRPLGINCQEDAEKAQEDGRQNALYESSLHRKDESLKDQNCQLATSATLDMAGQRFYVHAQPIKDPIWRGRISIFNQNFRTAGGLVAHLSRIACPRVREEAKILPRLLSSELRPRLAVWPKGFHKWGPTDDSIALYFFPDNERNEKVFDGLVKDMINEDLAMRVVVQNAELLIFPSIILPMEFWRFKTKLYLWGVFRGK